MTDYLWLDLETTGLDNKSRRIIEVAAIITGDDLIARSTWQDVVYQNPYVGWDQVALEMHQKSGLYDIIRDCGRHERDAIEGLTTWLKENTKDKQLNLAGNSIHFDRGFLFEQWPEVKLFLTHRHLDVSSFRIYADGQGVKKFSTQAPAHRAMDDIKHSLQEFAYYVAEIKKLP